MSGSSDCRYSLTELFGLPLVFIPSYVSGLVQYLKAPGPANEAGRVDEKGSAKLQQKIVNPCIF